MSDVGSVPLCGCEGEPHTCSESDDKPAARKKRKASTSPTQRTLADCRKRGWTAGVVEQFVRFPAPGHRRDLFGVIDVVAIVTGDDHPYDQRGILAIQACAGPSHADRRDKILAEPRARQWVEAGGRLELWSWSKRGGRHVTRKLWTLRVEVFTLDSWPAGSVAPAADPGSGYRRDDRD